MSPEQTTRVASPKLRAEHSSKAEKNKEQMLKLLKLLNVPGMSSPVSAYRSHRKDSKVDKRIALPQTPTNKIDRSRNQQFDETFGKKDIPFNSKQYASRPSSFKAHQRHSAMPISRPKAADMSNL